ncbi:hypothetical protein ES703_50947 [subsurface metagenome]
MPYRIVRRNFWQPGGNDQFRKEFFPLSPYQLATGLKESGQLSAQESQRLHNLELEENLAQAATQGVDSRAEEARGEITAEELQEHQRQARERLGSLEGGYFL